MQLRTINKIRLGGNFEKKKPVVKKAVVIGAGAWGSAIASVIAENNHSTHIIAHDKNTLESINQKHYTPNIPDVILPESIIAVKNGKKSQKIISDSDFIFLVTPSNAVAKTLSDIAKNEIRENATIILCSKGIDEKSGKLFSDIIEEILPAMPYAILSGPNFAVEVAKKLPTVTTIASKNKKTAMKVAELLYNKWFLPVISDDVVTTQIAGTVKNILAIGCGMVDGLELGENTKAALLTRGIGEIEILTKKLGGKSVSLISAAGFGDIFLTCSTTKSRNNSLGFKIGKGGSPKEILGDKNMVYEGAKSAKSIIRLAKSLKVKLPICSIITKILYSKSDQDVKKLLCQAIFE